MTARLVTPRRKGSESMGDRVNTATPGVKFRTFYAVGVIKVGYNAGLSRRRSRVRVPSAPQIHPRGPQNPRGRRCPTSRWESQKTEEAARHRLEPIWGNAATPAGPRPLCINPLCFFPSAPPSSWCSRCDPRVYRRQAGNPSGGLPSAWAFAGLAIHAPDYDTSEEFPISLGSTQSRPGRSM